MNIINILDKDFFTQYSYSIQNCKITSELNYYKEVLSDSSLNQNLIQNNFQNKYLPNIENYKDITDLSKIPQLGKIILQKNFQTPFTSLIELNNSINSPRDPENIFPIAVRYISSNGTYFIERPPFQTEVDFNRYKGRSTKFPPLKIWVPWTILVYNPRDPLMYHLYFSHKSLSSMEDFYFPSFFPNTYDDGRLCMGLSSCRIPTDNISVKNIKLMYSSIINEYMSGGWNTDLSPKHDAHLSSDLENLDPNKYPTLYLFNNPTFEYFKKHYPKMRTTTIEKLVDHKNYSGWRTSYFDSFRYYFFMMNTFDLETTLNFYSELSRYSKSHLFSRLSFETITKKTSRFDYNITNPSVVFNNVTPLLTRYLLSLDPSKDLLSSEIKRIYFIYPISPYIANDANDKNFFTNEIFHQLISKSLSSCDDKKVYHLDATHTKIEQEILVDFNTKISSYYLDYIRSLNSKDANV